jgi:putative SOS response-associated peptidase YedK
MCGRFTLAKDADALKKVFPDFPVDPRLSPRRNIAPTQPVTAWVADPDLRMEILSWGLLPPWVKDPSPSAPLINARAETLADKASFRNAYRRKRCLIPADGWFEWTSAPDKRKWPQYFHRRDGQPFVFAGLWEEWHDREGGMVLSCAIITTRANALVRRIHPRMPAVLREEDVRPWIDPLTPMAELPRMVEPISAEDFEVHAVSPDLNRAGIDHPRLLAPWQPPDLPRQGDLFA